MNSSPNARLEHFVVGGINLHWAFYELAREVLARRGTSLIFRHAYDAQVASMHYRGGGKVTFGQTLLLVPFIAAHLAAERRGVAPDEVMNVIDLYVDQVLRGTTDRDVEDLERFCNLALDQSRRSNAEHGINRVQPRPHFAGLYTSVHAALSEREFSQLFIVQEIAAGYPTVRCLVREWRSQQSQDLLRWTERVYPRLRERFARIDVAADMICVAMYWAIYTGREARLFG